MKYYIIALLFILVSSAYAIKVGDTPILPMGVKVGYGNIGVSITGTGVQGSDQFNFTDRTGFDYIDRTGFNYIDR